MRNLLVTTTNVNMGSGTSWSFFNLVKYVCGSGINPTVIVAKKD